MNAPAVVANGARREPPWFSSVPAHWTLEPLYARYWLSLGKMLDQKRITGENLVPYLRNIDVQWDRINVVDLPQMDIAPDEYSRFLLRAGDLLVCEGGEVGRAAIWHSELEECAFQKALHRLRPRSTLRDEPRFLFYALRHLAERGVFVAQGNPNTIPHLTGEMLRVYRIPFPPLAEQRAIAAFLDRETGKIDELISGIAVDDSARGAMGKMARLLKEHRSALISAAVTGQIDVRKNGQS